jgi:hypothetical protein
MQSVFSLLNAMRDDRWDSAYQAYAEVCGERHIRPEIVCQKFGIIRARQSKNWKSRDCGFCGLYGG